MLKVLKDIQDDATSGLFNSDKVSLADLIVLGGAAAIEKAAKDAGYKVSVPFKPGRGDATQEQTDVNSFSLLELNADGFRNYLKTDYTVPAEKLLVDRAQLLTLSAPEMTVLVGGLRVLGANVGARKHGVFTDKVDALTNDFFVNLLDMKAEWAPVAGDSKLFVGVDSKTGETIGNGTRADLVFGSNSQLREIADVYAEDEAKTKLAKDYAAA